MKFFQRYRFRWSLIAVVLAVLGAVLLYESLGGIRIETDILASLPQHDPVLADAHRVIRHLPVQDRLVIDVAISGGDRDALADGGDLVETGLRESRLFKQVGTQQMETLFPELLSHVVNHLPLLFDKQELETRVAPLLAPDQVRRALAEDLQTLQGLEGIGQTDLIARDPLGIRNLVLARMAELMPSKDAQLHRGKILSRDGRHLLVMAELAGAATDSAYTRAIPPLIEKLAAQLNAQGQSRGIAFTLTPVGAYRAALDNENAAKRDMRTAIVLTTLGIALLLILTFPRPLIGLLALIPSTVGALFALLVCSFFFPSLSILAVSFGGAIMAFTVDLGITYLLFLDRPATVSGMQAAREVQTGEILAALTTVGGFLLLLLSRFQVMAEIGLFAALGAAFAFAFVHWVFPRIFPVMPPALKPRNQWLGPVLDKVSLSGGNSKLAAAALFFAVMLFFARPVFLVDISAMNSLSAESMAAEKTVQRIWGDLTSRVYVMTQGRNLQELQDKNDRLAGMFREDIRRGSIAAAFSLGDLFPGEVLARRRVADWQDFWTPERVAELRRELERAGRESGFAPDAFGAFTASLTGPAPKAVAIPESFAGFLGIATEKNALVHLAMVTPGAVYQGEAFFARYSAANLASLFDAGLFNRRLGEVLVALFRSIAFITGLGIVLVVFFFFLEWRLTLLVLAPVLFALVGTLGTLKLLGHPIDIPGIMLWIVIMGMGIDYGIYYVCAYQRYLDERHPSMSLIRQAVFLAGASTLIGFGVLALAQHTVLRSIGLTSLLGIGYSLLGAFLIVPPLVKRVLVPVALPPEVLTAGSARHRARTLLRYRHIETTPRFFARGKLRMDPMFPRLAALVKDPRRILDIGCGYGVPSVWLLELHPSATVTGIDPDAERVRIAGSVLGPRGEARVGRAPDLGDLPGGADTALILDIIHMLSDTEWEQTLAHLHDKLLPGGRLVLRATIPKEGAHPWMRRFEECRLKRYGLAPRYRSRESLEAQIAAAGFELKMVETAAPGSEEVWFVADRRPGKTEDGGTKP
ncbi:MAG: methyltransferase domain-containing protein [Deltaproteobacteria bacterium]|nr:methyltransferase domain-containing protein [Deltaproteobacteria bacterium]